MTLTVTLNPTPVVVAVADGSIAVSLTQTTLAVSLSGVGPQGATGIAGQTGGQGPQGEPGAAGPQGNPGIGVPTGGSAGQALVKVDSANYNTEWATITSGVSSFNARTGAVEPVSGDYTIGEITGAATVASTGNYADLAGKPALGALAALNSASLTANVTGVLPPAGGGTGVNNGANTLTIGAAASVSGANTGDQTNITGNAGTATALQAGRAINGVNFDGTANITVAAAAGTLTGTALASNVVNSSLTSAAGGSFGTAAYANATAFDAAGSAAAAQANAEAFSANANNITSGTLAAARLPVPTAATLGGVESYAAVAHQWINAISTAGSPSSSQPAFSDISGTASVAQGGTGAASLTGLVKGNGTSPFAAAIAGTDYQSPITLTTSGTSGAATFSGGTLNIPQYAGTTYTAGAGLTLTGGAFSVNSTQSISALSNLTSNGLVKTSGGTGALSTATAGTDYVTPSGSIAGNAGTVSTINGLLAAGSNVTLSGSGTLGSPYTIAASGGGGSPGGSIGQVQYNGGGGFAGSAQLVFNNNALSVGGETALTYAQQVIRANSTQYAHLALTGYALSGGSQGDDAGFVMGMGYSDAGYGRQLWLGSTDTYNNAGRSMFRIGIGGSVGGYKAFMDAINGTGTQHDDLYVGGSTTTYFGVSGSQPVIPDVKFYFENFGGGQQPVTGWVAMLVRAASGQTADIQQWQDNSGSVLANVDRNGAIASGSGTTSGRPTVATTGARWFDTTLGIPIWWNGSHWINASGATV